MLLANSMRCVVVIALTSVAVFPEARRTRIYLHNSAASFRKCQIEACTVPKVPQWPTFSCSQSDPAAAAKDQEKINAFLNYLHGGDVETTAEPARPLLLDMVEDVVCPPASKMMPQIGVMRLNIGLEVASVEGSTCFLFRRTGLPVVCGCLSDQAMSSRGVPAIVTAEVKDQLPASCEILLMQPTEIEHRPPPSPVLPAAGSKTLCVATWNVGREWDKLAEYGIGSGMGLEGLKGTELFGGIDTLLGECGESSIVALGIQEGADPMLTQHLKELIHGKSLNLVANTYAMAKPWGKNILTEIPGLAHHANFFIRQGEMAHHGFTYSRRMIVLTTENLLAFSFQADTKDLVDDPASALQIDLPAFDIRAAQHESGCMDVRGVQLKDNNDDTMKCEADQIRLCADTSADRDDWLRAISLANLRARGQIVKEAYTKDTKGKPLLVVLTREKLYAFHFKVNPSTGRPAFALNGKRIRLGYSILHVDPQNDNCVSAYGVADLHLQKPSTGYQAWYNSSATAETIEFCAASAKEQESWIDAIRQASLARAAWNMPPDYTIQDNLMYKFGQVLGMAKLRVVTLSNAHLSTFDSNYSGVVGEPTNQLDLKTVSVEPEGEKSMWVTGAEVFQAGKIGKEVKFKLEVLPTRNSYTDTAIRDAWVAHIQQASAAEAKPKWNGYDENGILSDFILYLQTYGNSHSRSIETIVNDGLRKAIPGITDTSHIAIESVDESCGYVPRYVDGSLRTVWKTKVTLTDVRVKPGENLEGKIKEAFSSLGVQLLEEGSSLVLRLKDMAPQTKEPMAFLPFKTGVSIALFSETPASEVQLYSVDFRYASEDRKRKKENWLTGLKMEARKHLPTTADKGGAIVRAVINGKAMCFAACHFEANNANKRHQQAQLMADSLAAIPCDSAIWMGDFNTRPSKQYGNESNCCPWRELEYAVVHDLRDHIRTLTWNHDDFPEMIKGPYSEMPPLYRPTFHKRFKRDGHDECEGKEFLDGPRRQNRYAANLAMSGTLSSGVPVSSEDSNAKALMFANRLDIKKECRAPSKHTLCWGGDPLRQSCEDGKCFNTVDKSHCPGYTDRIIYLPGGFLSPLNYWPVEQLVEADHTPVVATFEVRQ